MDGASFATDPIFSHRCRPVQFMGPPRLFRAEAARQGLGADRAWVLNVGETRGW